MILIKHAWCAAAKINIFKFLAFIVLHFKRESTDIFFPSVFLTNCDHKGTKQAFTAAKWNMNI